MAGGYPQVPPKRSKPGKALIIVGTVLLVFGLLGLLGQAAKAVSNAEMAHVTEVAAVQVLW